MKKNLLLLVFLLNCYLGFSQINVDSYNSIQVDLMFGKPIEHDKSLKEAVKGNSYGFLLSFHKTDTKNTKFNNLYNYPEKGYSFLYQKFNSNILGEVYGAYRNYTYTLASKKTNKLKMTTAFGGGYATKSYDAITNNKNFAYGSKLLVSAYLKLQYFQFFNKNKISLNTGVSLIHFSNMSFKNPNLGINTVAFNLGVNYKLNPVKISKEKEIPNLNNTDKSINYNLVLRGGYNESLKVDSGLFSFYTVTFYASKKLNQTSTITGGVDYFNSRFLRNYVKGINIEKGTNYNINDYKRVGVFIGHELTQNNFAFVSQLGYILYYPYPYIGRIYERFGFKYNLNKHFFSEVTLKVNMFRAEAFEMGIGYRF